MPIRRWSFVLIAVSGWGCSKDTPAVAEAAASAVASAAPSASVVTAPSASGSAAPEVAHDCPTGSTGIGSFGKPCEAKGTVRMLEVAWNGKYDPNGNPSFKVASKAPKGILYGRVAVFFYDKAGQQIDSKEPIEGSDKTHAFHVCSGNNIFAGVLGAGEKATYTNFSCVKKKDVPDGTVAIEAEAPMVGFADASGKKTDFYWRNADLAPEARPKGGVK